MPRPNQSSQKIIDALVQLMQGSPFADITISEITHTAGVSRITFYRNFTTKEDILRAYINTVTENIENTVSEAPEASDLRTYFSLLFRAIAPLSTTFRRIFDAHLGEMILSAFNAHLFRTPRKKKEVSFDHYQSRFYTGAFFNILSDWILSGQKESPAKMADFCCSLIKLKEPVL